MTTTSVCVPWGRKLSWDRQPVASVAPSYSATTEPSSAGRLVELDVKPMAPSADAYQELSAATVALVVSAALAGPSAVVSFAPG